VLTVLIPLIDVPPSQLALLSMLCFLASANTFHSISIEPNRLNAPARYGTTPERDRAQERLDRSPHRSETVLQPAQDTRHGQNDHEFE
jgi:hypothetical protein